MSKVERLVGSWQLQWFVGSFFATLMYRAAVDGISGTVIADFIIAAAAFSAAIAELSHQASEKMSDDGV